MTAAAPVRLLLVDDDPLVRAGLRMMLGGTPSIEVVAEAADGAEVCALVRQHRPDVVLMDIRMPGVDGLTAAEQVRALSDPPQVVMLTTFNTDAHLLAALRLGAAGFLLKDTPPADIVAAVHRVAAGDQIMSPAVLRTLVAQVVGAAPDPERSAAETRARAQLDSLSARERDVVVRVAQGRTNAEIGAELYLSIATVKAHVSRILTKLGLNNRVQIALLVYNAGHPTS